MDSYPCTCAGDNSNCFKCYGTGLVRRPAPPPHLPAGLYSVWSRPPAELGREVVLNGAK